MKCWTNFKVVDNDESRIKGKGNGRNSVNGKSSIEFNSVNETFLGEEGDFREYEGSMKIFCWSSHSREAIVDVCELRSVVCDGDDSLKRNNEW
ncbi:hypothetical protein V6N12_022948 [Hibiscus sabdariffa]|uniref:Uncharacterized protein n=1 Tax=Hibiscus sabdariffa TaxID=183260 RepID=A0ABR2FWA8_9ROSI